MPTPNPTLRREYKGAAAATTLQNSISNTDISFVLVAANNWPTGSVGKFVITINRGQADEEKILCDSQTSRTVACLLANRGFDGTTAQAHAAGATVECTISAFDADEWNQHTNAATGVHGVATVAGLTETQTFTNKTLTAPTINGGVADAASTIGGVSGTSLAADRAAWTAWTVTGWSNITVGNSTIFASYRQVGKTVNFRIFFTAGNTSSSNGSIIQWSPPVATSASGDQWFAATGFNNASRFAGVGRLIASNGNMEVWLPTSTANCALVEWAGSMGGVAYASGFQFAVQGTYEAA